MSYLCGANMNNNLNFTIMKKYKTSIGVYDSTTGVRIGTITFASEARCQQINDGRAMERAKDIYRASRLTELADRYGRVIYRLVDDGLVDPISIYDFCIL